MLTYLHRLVWFVHTSLPYQAPDYAAGHILGTVNIPLGAEGGVNLSVEDGNFAIWVSFIVLYFRDYINFGYYWFKIEKSLWNHIAFYHLTET